MVVFHSLGFEVEPFFGTSRTALQPLQFHILCIEKTANTMQGQLHKVLDFKNRKLRVGSALVILLAIPACQSEVRPVDTTSNGSENSAHRVPDQPGQSALVPGTRFTSAQEDPRQDGWDTEVFAQQTLAQLKMLGKYLAEPGSANSETLAQLCADESTYSSLSPEGLAEVFRDSTMVVHRLTGEAPVVAKFRGATGLAELIQQFHQTLETSAGLHSKFKVIHVDTDGSPPSTRVHVQFNGQNGVKRLSVNATWKVSWQTGDAQMGPLLKRIELDSYEQVTVTSADPLFADCTVAILGRNDSFQQQLRPGIDHWSGSLDMRLGINVGGWQGLVLGDVNGDGLEDLYVCQPGGLPNRLFLQNADGTATDHSAASAVDWLARTQGALLLDLDNDRDQDLVVGVHDGILVHANDGTGKFELKLAKLLPAAVPYSLAAADYDQDGDLDIYVCCYELGSAKRRQVFPRAVPYHDANNGGRNVLLRNEGNWRFRQVTQHVGLDENNRRFSYAATWEDYDNDGDADLYVANDFGRNNLYQNDQGVFRDVAADAGVEDIGAGMSACWGDYDNDGLMDLYVANMFSSAGSRIAYQKGFHPGASEDELTALRRHARGNSLFRNRGEGRFEDVSIGAGVVMGRWAWGSKFVDLNLDGWEDLVVANGFVTQEDTGDL